VNTLRSLGIDRMSVADKLRLIDEIWGSIADLPEDVPIPDEVRAELDQRLDSADADSHPGSPWEEVKARLWQQP